MKSSVHALALLLSATTIASVGAAGCGVDEQVYNAAVQDRDAQKQKLAATQTDLDKERAVHKEGPGKAAGGHGQAGGARTGRLTPGDRARHAGRRDSSRRKSAWRS